MEITNYLGYILDIFYLKIFKIVIEEMEQRNNKETEFLNKINNCGLNVVWYSDKKSGYIYHKDFEYKFLAETRNYIDKSVDIIEKS